MFSLLIFYFTNFVLFLLQIRNFVYLFLFQIDFFSHNKYNSNQMLKQDNLKEYDDMNRQTIHLIAKGFVVGIGGIAPGLSGSVLLILFGLYQKTLEALATVFKNFKQNLLFLVPLLLGMVGGVLTFSKILDFLLNTFEVPTRFAFLGLILGTVPLFYREVKKNGFSSRYYLVIILAAAAGTWMFTVNPNSFPQIHDPSFLQSVLLGFAVVTTAIVPGIDPAVLLSTLGLYEVYVSSLASLDFGVLLPMVIGLGTGAVLVSTGMNALFKYFYTGTYSVIFGIFISMIPNILNERCAAALDFSIIGPIVLTAIGFCLSYWLGKIEENNKRPQAQG